MNENLSSPVCRDGIASSKLNVTCQKMASGEVMLGNKVDRSDQRVESMSQFDDLDFFLNPSEANDGGMTACGCSDGVKQWSGVGWLGWWRLSMVLNGGGYVLDAMDILMRPMIWVLFGIFKDLLTNLETQDLLAMVVVVGSSATVVVRQR
ncbi:hypothetical protein Tco_0913808 [Tanacetum coccineum]